MPKVSVLMAAYNAEKYISDAISSILQQTFTDFEFIIINDGSTDRTEEIILSFNDDRIIYERNVENLGIVKTRNKLLSLATSPYIAWLDSDDISLPQRLDIQYKFLSSHPNFVLCGSWAEIIQEQGQKTGEIWKPLIDFREIPFQMLFSNNFITSSVMARNLFPTIKFDTQIPLAEDFDLWHKYLQVGISTNINNVLIQYRINSLGATALGIERMDACKFEIIKNQWRNVGCILTASEEKVLQNFIFFNQESTSNIFALSKKLLLHYSSNKFLKKVLLRQYSKFQIRSKNPRIGDVKWYLRQVRLLFSFPDFSTWVRLVLIFIQSLLQLRIFKA